MLLCFFKSTIPEYHLELWPGYTTTIRRHENNILFCIDILNKIIQMRNVYALLMECMREDIHNYKQLFQSNIVGAVVLTDYNNRTYRIDGVDWNKTPTSKFLKWKVQMSYTEYYLEVSIC